MARGQKHHRLNFVMEKIITLLNSKQIKESISAFFLGLFINRSKTRIKPRYYVNHFLQLH
jgi:hypothetical protein